MKWIKKQFNKLFHTINDENEYEEIEEKEEQTKQNEPINKERRSTFRFPLIADEELDSNNLNNNELEKKKPIQLPNYYYDQPISSQVYDVEVSRISELLAQRREANDKNRKGRNTKRISSNPTLPTNNREPQKRSTTREDKTITREIINPLENRKRFIPTEVPSPVYGFAKPSSINTLLNKNTIAKVETTDIDDIESLVAEHNEREDSIQEELLKGTQEVASSVTTQEEIVEKKQHDDVSQQENTEQFIEKDNSQTNLVEEVIENFAPKQPLVEDQELPREEIIVKEQHESITQQEYSEQFVEKDSSQTILVEEVNENIASEQPLVEDKEPHQEENEEFKEQASVQEEYSPKLEAPSKISDQLSFGEEREEVQDEELQLENGQPTEKKRGPIPFNVVMLKSDKEKLLKKQSLKIEENENGPIKEEQLQHTQVAKLLERAYQDMDETVNLQEGPSSDSNESIENNSNFSIEESSKVEEQEQHEQQTTEVKNKSDVENSEDKQLPKEQEQNKPTLPPKQYVKPPLEYLAPPEEKTTDKEWMESQADVLVESLSHFQVTAHVESIVQGPAVTQFEITVGQGTKVSKIRNLADDLKLALAAKDIRIQAPIPGKSSIGIEIPNRISRAVQLSEITSSDSFIQSESPLEAALGLDLTGTPVTIDLRKMPHGMIAGATGSGKSVCINSILVSLLYKADPQELKLMLIDPKMVELAPFNHIPHLVSPVITDVKAATAALKWAVDEMERRYKLFAHVGVRDISRFNKQAEQNEEYGHKLPYILIVIDELADLMMMSPADVEEAICRIAQKARACGIHLIIATQRPSVDVITGLIKSNIPTRIAFAVSSQVDSRTILDQQGAERLLGRGDMLYLGNGMSAPIRIQGTFVTDDEIEQIVDHVRQQGEPDYIFEQDELLKKAEMIEEYDELFEEVCRFVYEQGSASTSSIQRRYHIGYNRAARLVDMLESHGFVSENKGSKPRDVFITESDLTRIFG